MRSKRHYFLVTGEREKAIKADFHKLAGFSFSLEHVKAVGTISLTYGRVTAVMTPEALYVHSRELSKAGTPDLKPISEYKFRKAIKKAMEGGAS